MDPETGETLTLAPDTVHDPFGDLDQIPQIRNIVGTSQTDVIFGGTQSNILLGGDGGDIIDGGNGADHIFGESGNDFLIGGAGADVVDGGSGVDIASYQGSTAGVEVHLGLNGADGFGIGGDAEGDVLRKIEGLFGSNYNDTFFGNELANAFRGGAGDDNFFGGGGSDIFYGVGSGTVIAPYIVGMNEIAESGDNNIFGGDGDNDEVRYDKPYSDYDFQVYDWLYLAKNHAPAISSLANINTNYAVRVIAAYGSGQDTIDFGVEKFSFDGGQHVIDRDTLRSAAMLAFTGESISSLMNALNDLNPEPTTSLELSVVAAATRFGLKMAGATVAGDIARSAYIDTGLAVFDVASGLIESGVGIFGPIPKIAYSQLAEQARASIRQGLAEQFDTNVQPHLDNAAFLADAMMAAFRTSVQIFSDVVVEARDALGINLTSEHNSIKIDFDKMQLPHQSNFNAAPVLASYAFGASVGAGGWSNDDTFHRTLADVNGDGRADIVGFGYASTVVSLAKSTGGFDTPIIGVESFGYSAAGGGWGSNNYTPRTAADVSGDGLADIIGFGYGGTYVSLATGGGQFASPVMTSGTFGSSAGAGGWSDNNFYHREVADVNGDGMADIVGFGYDGTYVALATGGGNFAAAKLASPTFGASAAAGGWSDDNIYHRELADVNGDGMADIVGFGSDTTYVALATGAGNFAAAIPGIAGFGASAAGGSWSNQTTYPRHLADVDGDGRADIVGFGYNGVLIASGNSDGTFQSAQADLEAFGVSSAAGGWSDNNLYPRLLGDIDRNGTADIIGFGSDGAYVSRSEVNWV